MIDQRCEDRYTGIVDRAVITFREQEYIVPVINISTRGTMIECEIMPRIGETIIIQFEASQANITRLRALLGWAPSIDLATGVREIVAHEREALLGAS